ncbi:phosphate ABC transporter substrate-binding protein PstS [Aeromicrobium sp. PE09-221]|uniref:phosphate ABC transporter substrate-binding protein PstS n=1 Tax=Aeromicrobium sp. PE09-221 TaxID=1898043 RepID=UPI000B6A94BD|nr:phosphate ABC transporter substrate-binding protein PstS [Aeromicrobium sp. PE09-221]OUZ07500.1 phosphate ABC transporter substrate-binding protein PstS [Aeromicrobium sp. PE09-221]
MKSKSMRKAAALGAGAVLALGLTACGAGNESGDGDESSSDLSGTLNGAGASSQQAAVSAWQQGFQTENSDVTVNYDPIGSGGGREQFLAGGTDFAGSDAYLDDEELTQANDLCGQIVSVPTYVSPIAVIYNLPGVDGLQLSPSTIGSIFAGDITTWNDPAIAEDNPDAELPDSAITPVHRSDDSGTTENFTEYLDAASEGTWTAGVVETWPTQGGEAANGTSGVVAAVESGEGTIGYADASQAGDLGQVAVKVGDEYVAPTEEAAARVLDTAEEVEGREDTDIALELDRATTEDGVYPIVLVSYQMACQTYEDADKAELVKSWLTYVVSEDGQQAAADSAGSAPLTDDFREKVQTAIDTIGG